MTDSVVSSPSPDVTREQAEAICLRLDGELTISRSGELLEVLGGSLEGNERLVADFSQVQECDAAGLQLLLSWRKTAAERGRRIRITALSAAIHAAADALGLPAVEIGDAEPGGAGHGL